MLDGAGENKQRVVPADLVILATGFRGDQKLKNMFVSPRVKDIIASASDTAMPLYRECVHPRIPQMAVVGYAEGLNNIYVTEMAAKWVARLLDGAFRLPGVRPRQHATRSTLRLSVPAVKRPRSCYPSPALVSFFLI